MQLAIICDILAFKTTYFALLQSYLNYGALVLKLKGF